MTQSTSKQPHLIRGVGLAGATTLNVIDMVGVGPFITIPLIVAAAGGPQAMLGWIIGALFAVCDGLVWAELGAAMPQAGGTYRYLNEIYGPKRLGRMLSFLFIWQLSFSAPLSMASGAIGLSLYASYIWPSLATKYIDQPLALPLGPVGTLEANFSVSNGTLVAIAVIVVAVVLLYRRVTVITKISGVLAFGAVATILWIIFAGLTHFEASKALSFPPNAFTLDERFFLGMGAALLIAAYDYWGYYNVCFLGEEIKDPVRNIPRALLLSIAIVATMYIVMNISILGVVPWQEMMGATKDTTKHYIASVFMERVYGSWAAYAVTAMIMWTAFASIFSLLLGYSRVPYAAALDGNYFRAMARVHPTARFPHVSLLALAAVAILFCFIPLADVIAALVVIRISIQFLVQIVGLLILRQMRPDYPRPFRMWLYPLPALIAVAGFLFILVSRTNFLKEIRYAAVLVVLGSAIYLLRARKRREWPFTAKE